MAGALVHTNATSHAPTREKTPKNRRIKRKKKNKVISRIWGQNSKIGARDVAFLDQTRSTKGKSSRPENNTSWMN